MLILRYLFIIISMILCYIYYIKMKGKISILYNILKYKRSFDVIE